MVNSTVCEVDLLPALRVGVRVVGERGDAEVHERRHPRAVLRGVLVEEPVEVPQHRVGVEVRSVMELDALAEPERPLRLVVRVHLPALREPRNEPGGLVGGAHVPVDERVVEHEAHEAEPFEPLVGLSPGEGNVGRGHPDPQGPSGTGGGGGDAGDEGDCNRPEHQVAQRESSLSWHGSSPVSIDG